MSEQVDAIADKSEPVERTWPKFIQISNSTSHDDDGQEWERLYALDEDGGVWWYDFVDSYWRKLPDRDRQRKTTETRGSHV